MSGDVDVDLAGVRSMVFAFCLRLLIIYQHRRTSASAGESRPCTAAYVRDGAPVGTPCGSTTLVQLTPVSELCSVWNLSPLLERGREGEGPHYGSGIRRPVQGLPPVRGSAPLADTVHPRGWLHTVRVNEMRT